MSDESSASRKYIRYFWTIYVAVAVLVLFIFFLIARGFLGFMPSFEDLENTETILASEVISDDDKVLGTFFSENRTFVSYESLPPHLVQALIATEDVRFFRHSGIDLRGLMRVIKGILTGNTSSGGGSTISQQLAKMLFPREQFRGPIQLAFRKFREWIIAVKLERSFTKEEILTMYLNKYDFLNLAVGIKSAANVYFNCETDSLQLHQAAMLVGMAKNSALYNPLRRPEITLQRRNVVLSQMQKYGYITPQVFDSVKQLPLGLDFKPVDFKQGLAPYFREYLRLTLNASKPDRKNYASFQTQKFIEDSVEWETNPLFGWCQKNKKRDGSGWDLYKDGLKIYTTVDSRMQLYAEEALAFHLKNNLQPLFDNRIKNLKNPPFSNDMTAEETEELLNRFVRQSERYRVLASQGKNYREIREIFNKPVEMSIFSWEGEIDTIMAPIDSIKWYLRFFRSSLMAMENGTGKVKAYVGGPNYEHFMYDMVKGGKRQVGSTVKPFLYTLAMQNGLTPCTKVPYVRQQFVLPDGRIWEPRDASRDEENYGKMVTLKWGLANSRNMISAWVMKQFNPEAMAAVMQKLGIYSPIDPVYSMFLGTSDITLYEMVGAFGTYVNKGVFIRPYFVTHIEDRHGNVVANFIPQRVEAIDENTAFLMVNLLQGVVNEGTGSRLRFREGYGKFTMPIAGKTGTTQNHSDGWFIGMTPQLSTGIWTGADLRSIRFADISTGQGANMALPIWGYFMKKVLADPTLGYTENTSFERPPGFDVDLECTGSDPVQEGEVLEFEDFL
ncbi:MAG: transglycosylase domain-containing protein [Bacteroidota bacterium]|jgi:penicillin-binding protein 1A|nr:transglycosylase domain-containing protein [Bacteroidota bacterium]NLS98368.1 penicillin-binding protein [Bacteroidales bacterium]HNZ69901.1 transglycosylase domain-containing protein [Prolixibacteraceae bacterium]HOC87475.1 transglycosylase domain-containing protein [Prolixibacteraceae bacterium]HOG96784.1 transglycosylase domain-containing protein [Prolixibacteraceae bacterium]